MRVELKAASRRRRRAPHGLAAVGRRGPVGRAGTPLTPRAVLACLVVVATLAYVVFALMRSAPVSVSVASARTGGFPRGPARLAWPRHGQAAVAVQGVGLIGAHGSPRPTAIASVAKVMTAYVVLGDHPLPGHASGPQIIVRSPDVAVYSADLAAGQSVLAVRAGERLTERQALQGLLLASGNNIATLLARWDAGTEGAFVNKMNERARALGLAHTRTMIVCAACACGADLESRLARCGLAGAAVSRPS